MLCTGGSVTTGVGSLITVMVPPGFVTDQTDRSVEPTQSSGTSWFADCRGGAHDAPDSSHRAVPRDATSTGPFPYVPLPSALSPPSAHTFCPGPEGVSGYFMAPLLYQTPPGACGAVNTVGKAGVAIVVVAAESACPESPPPLLAMTPTRIVFPTSA